MAQSSSWFLPQSTTSYEPCCYSIPKVYRDEKNYSGTMIFNFERNHLDMQHRTYEPILHPDTMEPMDPNKIQTILNAQRKHEAISRSYSSSKRPVELRIDGSWSLGITMSNDGVITRIHEGTPASRARLIFESRDGMWLSGQSKINPGDTLVAICGLRLTDKGQVAYDLCHSTVGKSEVRLTFSRNVKDSIFRSVAPHYIVTLYREPADERPQHSRAAVISDPQPFFVFEPVPERGSERMVVQPSYSYEAPAVEQQSECFIPGQVISVQYVGDYSSQHTAAMPPAGTTREYTSAEWPDNSYRIDRESTATQPHAISEHSWNGASRYGGHPHSHEGYARYQAEAVPYEAHGGGHVVRGHAGDGAPTAHAEFARHAPLESRFRGGAQSGPIDRTEPHENQPAMLEALLNAAIKPPPAPKPLPVLSDRPNVATAAQPGLEATALAKRDSEAAIIVRKPGQPARAQPPPAPPTATPPYPPPAEPQGGRRGSLRELRSFGGPQDPLRELAPGAFHGQPGSTEPEGERRGPRRGQSNSGSFRGLPAATDPAIGFPKPAAVAPGGAKGGRIAMQQQWLASDDDDEDIRFGANRASLGRGNGDAGPARGTGRGELKSAARPLVLPRSGYGAM